MSKRIHDSLQQPTTSHGNQPNYTGPETTTSDGLSVSKVLKTESGLCCFWCQFLANLISESIDEK